MPVSVAASFAGKNLDGKLEFTLHLGATAEGVQASPEDRAAHWPEVQFKETDGLWFCAVWKTLE